MSKFNVETLLKSRTFEPWMISSLSSEIKETMKKRDTAAVKLKISFGFAWITPAIAQKLLATQDGNRKISPKLVTAYSEAMRMGAWMPTSQGLGFDTKGRLIDGQHRLTACVKSGIPFYTLIVTGLPEESQEGLDRNRPRKIHDDLHRRGDSCPRWRAAYVNLASWLIARQIVVSTTIQQFDQWYPEVKDGVDAMIDILSTTVYRSAGIAGAFAFAYRKNPKAVKKLAHQLSEGESTKYSPAWALSQFLIRFFQKNGGQTGGSGRKFIVTRVLIAAYAEAKGKSLQEITASDDATEAMDYFRSAYDTPAVRALCLPWTTVMPGDPSGQAQNRPSLARGTRTRSYV